MLLQKSKTYIVNKKESILSDTEKMHYNLSSPYEIEKKDIYKKSTMDNNLFASYDNNIENEYKTEPISLLNNKDNIQENKKEKEEEKNHLKNLGDITIDTLFFNKCQNFNKLCFIRLPIIVIDENYYINFREFLIGNYKYSKYKENTILYEYLILGSNEIQKYEPFHVDKNREFAAECINTDLIRHYDKDEIYSMNNKLKEYFEKNDIKDIGIDFYYDNWINDVMNLFSDFLYFNHKLHSKIVKCDKCKKSAIFINNINNVSSNYEPTTNNKININNNLLNEKEKKNIKKDNSLINIIYYDEEINDHRNEIVENSNIFEKECNGTLLLVTNKESLLLILENIKNSKDSPKFHLVCSGQNLDILMGCLQKFNDLDKYIIAVAIYTYNTEKYSNLKKEYNIIKGIYSEKEEIIDYIKKNKSDKNIKYKIANIITYKEYTEKYIELHKIISLEYRKLYQDSKKTDLFDLKSVVKNLEAISKGSNNSHEDKKPNNENAYESFYILFNKWLNQKYSSNFRKIAFFIANIQLSLNIYGKRDNKGYNSKSELYGGALINYPLVLNYERNIGNIITFPSFFSTSLDKEIANNFSQYNESKENRKGLFSANYIICINPGNDCIAQGFDISDISNNKYEKEILFQPFTFFKINNVKVDLTKNICFINLELIGKKEIWEEKMNEKSNIDYQVSENFIKLNY